MSLCALTLGLIVAGGLLQAVSIGMLAHSIRADRRRAAPLFQEDVTIQAPTARVSASASMPYIIEGRTPTVDERLERLETQLAEVREDTRSRIESLQNEVERRIQSAAGAVGQEAQTRYVALRTVMQELLTADLSHRKRTVVLLIVGVTLATAGGGLSLWTDC